MPPLKLCLVLAIGVVLAGLSIAVLRPGEVTIPLRTSPEDYIGEFLLENPTGVGESTVASLVFKHRSSDAVLFRQRIGYSHDTMEDAVMELRGWNLTFDSLSGRMRLFKGSKHIELLYTTQAMSDTR